MKNVYADLAEDAEKRLIQRHEGVFFLLKNHQKQNKTLVLS